MRQLERNVLLNVIDRKWREHLYEMDYLKEGIGLRAMAQRDPLVEYQREGYDMFIGMLDGLKEESVGFLFNVQVEAAPRSRPQWPRSPLRRVWPNSPRPLPRTRRRSRSRPPRPLSGRHRHRPARARAPAGLRAKGIDDGDAARSPTAARPRTVGARCSATAAASSARPPRKRGTTPQGTSRGGPSGSKTQDLPAKSASPSER